MRQDPTTEGKNMQREDHKNLDQRIGVYVDAQNIYYSARFLYNRKVDFQSILKDAVRGRHLIRAIVYVIKAEMPGEEAWFDRLETIGFDVKSKDIQIFPGGAKKGDWDIGIAMDAIEMAPKLDAIVIVSGDGDFVPLVQHLQKAHGCRVEAMAFGKSASAMLVEAVDEFIDLEKDKARYLRNVEAEKRHDRNERSAPETENIRRGPPPQNTRARSGMQGKARTVRTAPSQPQTAASRLPRL